MAAQSAFKRRRSVAVVDLEKGASRAIQTLLIVEYNKNLRVHSNRVFVLRSLNVVWKTNYHLLERFGPRLGEFFKILCEVTPVFIW